MRLTSLSVSKYETHGLIAVCQPKFQVPIIVRCAASERLPPFRPSFQGPQSWDRLRWSSWPQTRHFTPQCTSWWTGKWLAGRNRGVRLPVRIIGDPACNGDVFGIGGCEPPQPIFRPISSAHLVCCAISQAASHRPSVLRRRGWFAVALLEIRCLNPKIPCSTRREFHRQPLVNASVKRERLSQFL